MAIEDQDRPDGGGVGPRAGMPAGSAAAPGTSAPGNAAEPAEGPSGKPEPVNRDVPLGVDGHVATTGAADEAGQPGMGSDQPEGRSQLDDYDPYLPPGSDPFSAGYPQDPPPYPPGEPSYREPLGAEAGTGYPPPADATAAGERAGYPQQPGYPRSAPYLSPTEPDQGGGYQAQEGYEATSAFPPYEPYGYDPNDQSDWSEDAMTGYGSAAEQGYGYPAVDPLSDAAAPDSGYPAVAPQGYPAGPLAQPTDDPARSTPGLDRGRQGLAEQVPADRETARPAAVPSDTAAGRAAAAVSGQPGPGQPRPGQPGAGQQRELPPDAAWQAPGTPDGLGGDLLPPRAPESQETTKETADSLTSEALLHGKRPAPGSGWRRTVYKVTGGLVRVGESAAAQRRRELVWRVRTPVAGGHHRVAVMSLKGGVGKTTTTVGLGATLATLRGDRVIAVDANPDRGTLSDKVRLETSATVRDLLNERQQISRYADVRAFTSQAPSRLEVLASDRDPAVSVAFSEDDYYDVARVLEHYYSICLTDCGTGLLHSAMAGVLRLADQIVLVSSPSVDGARSASATLDWLEAHDYGDLVRNAVVVLSTVRPRSKSTVDLDRLEQHFATRCRAVARIPYDPHLEEGAEVELEQLSQATTEAYLVLAATVGDGFAWPRRAIRRSA